MSHMPPVCHTYCATNSQMSHSSASLTVCYLTSVSFVANVMKWSNLTCVVCFVSYIKNMSIKSVCAIFISISLVFYLLHGLESSKTLVLYTIKDLMYPIYMLLKHIWNIIFIKYFSLLTGCDASWCSPPLVSISRCCL